MGILKLRGGREVVVQEIKTSLKPNIPAERQYAAPLRRPPVQQMPMMSGGSGTRAAGRHWSS